jgi:hypothetical protein
MSYRAPASENRVSLHRAGLVRVAHQGSPRLEPTISPSTVERSRSEYEMGQFTWESRTKLLSCMYVPDLAEPRVARIMALHSPRKHERSGKPS